MKYKYDVAFSLCKEDAEYVRSITKELNPSLNCFFYEDRQEEMVTKSGPEEFSKKFKDEARVVVVVARKHWGESYYTGIEKSAIIDRTSVQNQGYGFLMMIPLDKGSVPCWYPSTRIYIDPERFGVKEIARFIEFKVTEEGGEIKPLSVKEQYDWLLKRMDEKHNLINLQKEKNALEAGKSALTRLKELFNTNVDNLSNEVFDPIIKKPFSQIEFSQHDSVAYFQIWKYRLSCNLMISDQFYSNYSTAQDIKVIFNISKINWDRAVGSSFFEDSRYYLYSLGRNNWSLRKDINSNSKALDYVLFCDKINNTYYDLKDHISIEEFVDTAFQKLLSISSRHLEEHIK